MLESFLAVPLHFTIELLGFVLCAGGAVLVLSRPNLIPGAFFNRGVGALGLAALGAAQVLHGASISDAATDGSTTLVALHAAGWIFLTIALVNLPKEGAGALVIGQPLAFAAAGAAVLATLAGLRAARRTGLGALLRLSMAAFLIGGADALTAFAPDARFGLGSVSPYAYAAHGLKLLGFLALGAWLASGVRSSIRSRFVGAFAVLLVVVVLVLSTALTAVISDNVGDAQLTAVSNQLESQSERVTREEVADLLAQTGQIAGLPDVQRRVAARTAPGNLALALNEELDFFETDFVALLDRRGIQLAFTKDGPVLDSVGGGVQRTKLKRGDVLSILGSSVVTGLIDGSKASASVDVVPGRNIPLILAGAPISSPDGGRAGYLVTARFLDLLVLQDMADSLRPVEATLVVGRQIFASTLPEGVSAQRLVPPQVRRDLAVGDEVRRQQDIGSQSYFSALAPLRDALNTPTSAALVLSAPSSVVVDTREDVIRVLFLIALLVGAMVLMLAALFGRRIARPIQQLTAAAGRVREGDLEVTAPVGGQDEVGQLGETFNDMTASLLRMTNDLRTAAREEHELRERIEKIIQSMADGLVAVDAEGRVLAFNAEAELMTGLDTPGALGRPVHEVITAIDAQGSPVRLPIHDLKEGSVGGIFLRRLGRDPVPVTLTSAILRDEDGRIAGSVTVMRDMTREREIERMKSEFLSNISHELRTPLTPIKGYAEMLARKKLSEDKYQQFASGILDSTTRLERIVGLLVDFAALEAGRLSPTAKPVDLGVLIERLRFEWARRDRRHEFEAEIEGELPAVIGDERLLKRSIEEIIDNAVKFSPQGGLIRLEARRVDNGESETSGITRIEIVVTDEGIGIEPENIARVFSDFQQLDGSETRTYGGLGLGLAFVRRIVEAHDGTVDVQSEPNLGTRMIVAIPALRHDSQT